MKKDKKIIASENDQEPKEVNNKKKIVIVIPVVVPICSCILVGGIVGGVVGAIYGHNKKPPIEDFNAALEQAEQDERQNEIANAGLLDRYEQCKAENKEPSEVFTYSEMCNIAIQKFIKKDKTLALGFGYAAAAGDVAVLDVRNIAIVNGDTYFEESVSKSAAGVPVKVAERAFQKSGSIEVHEATFKNGSDAEHPSWKSEISSTYDLDGYKDKYGKTVDTLGIYIVSEKTVIQPGENCGVTDKGSQLVSNTHITKDETGYTVYMDMDPIRTIPRYVRRMHALSNSDVAKFFYVNLEYRLDLDLNLVYSYAHEEYAAKLGNISANTTGRMITYYYTDQEYSIPEVTTNFDYNLKGEKLPEV